MEPAIKIRDLRKVYGSRAVVKDVDLKVDRGQIYGLVGRNGAGKTTILRMICGCTAQSGGELSLFGASDEAGLRKERGRLGAILESPSFYPYFTAKQNLEYYRMLRGIPDDQSAEEALDLVGLNDTGNKKYKEFSMGMKQKLGLALAVMGNPDLLVLDEPINGMDPMGIVEFRRMITRLNREKGVTVLISSHILGELSQMATHYGFLENGRMIEQISAEEIHNRCRKSVLLEVDDAPRAAVLLEEKLGIRDYEALDAGRLRVYESIDLPEILAQTLVLGGISLYSMIPQETNLENYYVNLVGGERDA